MGLFSKIFGNNNIVQLPVQPDMTPAQPDLAQPAPNTDGSGVMIVEDIFSVKGRGTIVVGKIESGTFKVGQSVTIDTVTGQISTTIAGLEVFHKAIDFASAGDNVGMLLKDIDKDTLNQGDMVQG